MPGLADGPIVSFLPIFVMGVLFGLAMDYEMFLVSAMREDFVTHGRRRTRPWSGGFQASSRVVTAAALIMISVFVAFIPAGTATIQQIAFGLAVGVFVDAFLVRMTLVPGRAGAARPAGLVAAPAGWTARCPSSTWRARHCTARSSSTTGSGARADAPCWPATWSCPRDAAPVQLSAQRRSGEPRCRSRTADDRGALGRVLAGRRPAVAGELVVGGLLLPEQREAVNRAATLLELARRRASPGGLGRRIRCATGHGLASLSRPPATTSSTEPAPARWSTSSRQRQLRTARMAPSLQRSCDAALGLRSGVDVFVFSGLDAQTEPDRRSAGLLAEELARRGATVVVVAHGTAPARPPVPLATNGNPPDPAPPPVRAGARVPTSTAL